jgi:DNA polymerase-1
MAKRISHVFSSREKLAISWNGGFDDKHLIHRGFRLKTRDADGMVGVWLLDEMLAKSKQIGLKKQAKAVLGVEMAEFEDTRLIEGIVDEKALAYASDDAKYTYVIWHDYVRPKLEEDNLLKVFERICMPVLRVLAEMELNGTLIDVDQLREVEQELTTKNEAVLQELRTMSGNPKFNPGSSKQLSVLLFGPASVLRLPVKKGHEWKVKSGQWSTDKRTLRRYKNDHPIFEKLTEYRKSKKLLTTYAIPLQERARQSKDGRVRSSFRQTGTVTGRLSSSNPNFQNISTKGGIREAFVAPEGSKLIVADYNQLELRMGGCMAHRTFGRSHIVEKYQQGLDLHEATRQTYDALGIDRFNEAAVGAEEARRNAKIANFGYFYGRSADAFAQDNPEVAYPEAVTLRELFLTKLYPEITAMHDHCVKDLVENGYVKTITGRRRRFKYCYARDPQEVWWEGWVGWNSVVQGSAQDLIQIAMRDVYADICAGRAGQDVQSDGKVLRLPPETWERVKPLIQVHDELVVETPEYVAEDIAAWLSYRMGKAVSGQIVDFPAEAGIGQNWIEAKNAPKKDKAHADEDLEDVDDEAA